MRSTHFSIYLPQAGREWGTGPQMPPTHALGARKARHHLPPVFEANEGFVERSADRKALTTLSD